MSLSVDRPASLDADTRRRIRALADEHLREDGQPPLSDQALTQLASDTVRHLVASDGDVARAYAQLAGDSLEIVADGAGAAVLLDALAPLDPAVRVWSHGRRSPIGPALAERGFRQARILHQLRRPFDGPVPLSPLTDGISIRAFAPGADEAAWLVVNAAAFTALPEQGSLTLTDLRAREAEPWFDPAGFLLAEREGVLVGFHWTKIHPDGLGEVYVLGIAPGNQGLGLGGALLSRGLAHLAERGCPSVLLYVDDDNVAGLHLYERDGFTRFDHDVQWAPR